MIKILPPFLTSICQGILFGIVYIACAYAAYMFDISWINEYVILIMVILIPIVSACGLCFLINRDNFCLSLKTTISKGSSYKLYARLLSVFCILVIGYMMDKSHAVPPFISDLLSTFGEYGATIEAFLANFGFYIVIVVFQITYALTEYRFVVEKNDCTG